MWPMFSSLLVRSLVSPDRLFRLDSYFFAARSPGACRRVPCPDPTGLRKSECPPVLIPAPVDDDVIVLSYFRGEFIECHHASPYRPGSTSSDDLPFTAAHRSLAISNAAPAHSRIE